MVYVLLAPGFEEMEAIAPIDLMRRAGLDVQTVAVSNNRVVTGSHGIPVTADLLVSDVQTDGLQAVILPGGLPGTTNLEADATVQSLIDFASNNGLVLGAICAAPSVLGHKGLLCGKKAVCFPGFESALQGASVDTDALCVIDGTIVTAKGAGAAVEFGLALVAVLVSDAVSQKLREGIQCK